MSRVVELPARMTLASYIEALEKLPGDAEVPLSKLFSWRGSYDELSVDPAGRNTARDLLDDAQTALDGRLFAGYKGGEYRMFEWTAIWADPYGEYLGRQLVSVELVAPEIVVTITGGVR